ncbi:hypothetical protein D3C76_1460600 [compost metagenome]
MLSHTDVRTTGVEQGVTNFLVQQRDGSLVQLSVRTEAEQHARQLRLHDQLKVILSLYVLRHILRQRYAVVDDRRVLLLTQGFQAHPQLQRVETARGLQ